VVPICGSSFYFAYAKALTMLACGHRPIYVLYLHSLFYLPQ